MNHWTGEADIRIAAPVNSRPEQSRETALLRQQHEMDAQYGLHNYLVLDSLLKQHLHLDKGFDL